MNPSQFIDFYEDLQVSSNADQETIERVYRLLAKRYHPDNSHTGNIDKFESITNAYKILSDPEKRAAYDAKHSENRNIVWKALSEKIPSNDYENDKYIRKAILSVLYVERRQNVTNSGIGVWHLEKLLSWPEEILEFHIWYLKEKGWIERTETGGFAITASGVDAVEQEGLILRKDRLIEEASGMNTVTDDPHLIEDKQ
jgi:curved DNA-binding protein CbpA